MIDKLVDNKAQDIISIDIHKKSSIIDCMIVSTGTSSHYLTSVSEKLIEGCYKRKIILLNVIGKVFLIDHCQFRRCNYSCYTKNNRQMYEVQKL
ncbi:MAG: RsfS/YbeB/iojap family protein [Arsenophonus sp.]